MTKERVDELLSSTKKLSIQSSEYIQRLSVPKYTDLVDWVFEMKTKHNSPDRHWVTSLTLDSVSKISNTSNCKDFTKRVERYIRINKVQMETLPNKTFMGD